MLYTVICYNHHQLLNIFSINSFQFDIFQKSCGRPHLLSTPLRLDNLLILVRTPLMDDPLVIVRGKVSSYVHHNLFVGHLARRPGPFGQRA